MRPSYTHEDRAQQLNYVPGEELATISQLEAQYAEKERMLRELDNEGPVTEHQSGDKQTLYPGKHQISAERGAYPEQNGGPHNQPQNQLQAVAPQSGYERGRGRTSHAANEQEVPLQLDSEVGRTNRIKWREQERQRRLLGQLVERPRNQPDSYLSIAGAHNEARPLPVTDSQPVIPSKPGNLQKFSFAYRRIGAQQNIERPDVALIDKAQSSVPQHQTYSQHGPHVNAQKQAYPESKHHNQPTQTLNYPTKPDGYRAQHIPASYPEQKVVTSKAEHNLPNAEPYGHYTSIGNQDRVVESAINPQYDPVTQPGSTRPLTRQLSQEQLSKIEKQRQYRQMLDSQVKEKRRGVSARPAQRGQPDQLDQPKPIQRASSRQDVTPSNDLKTSQVQAYANEVSRQPVSTENARKPTNSIGQYDHQGMPSNYQNHNEARPITEQDYSRITANPSNQGLEPPFCGQPSQRPTSHQDYNRGAGNAEHANVQPDPEQQAKLEKQRQYRQMLDNQMNDQRRGVSAGPAQQRQRRKVSYPAASEQLLNGKPPSREDSQTHNVQVSSQGRDYADDVMSELMAAERARRYQGAQETLHPQVGITPTITIQPHGTYDSTNNQGHQSNEEEQRKMQELEKQRKYKQELDRQLYEKQQRIFNEKQEAGRPPTRPLEQDLQHNQVAQHNSMPYQGTPQQGAHYTSMPQQGMQQQGAQHMGIRQQDEEYMNMPQKGIQQHDMHHQHQSTPQQRMQHQGNQQYNMPQRNLQYQDMQHQGMNAIPTQDIGYPPSSDPYADIGMQQNHGGYDGAQSMNYPSSRGYGQEGDSTPNAQFRGVASLDYSHDRKGIQSGQESRKQSILNPTVDDEETRKFKERLKKQQIAEALREQMREKEQQKLMEKKRREEEERVELEQQKRAQEENERREKEREMQEKQKKEQLYNENKALQAQHTKTHHPAEHSKQEGQHDDQQRKASVQNPGLNYSGYEQSQQHNGRSMNNVIAPGSQQYNKDSRDNQPMDPYQQLYNNQSQQRQGTAQGQHATFNQADGQWADSNQMPVQQNHLSHGFYAQGPKHESRSGSDDRSNAIFS